MKHYKISKNIFSLFSILLAIIMVFCACNGSKKTNLTSSSAQEESDLSNTSYDGQTTFENQDTENTTSQNNEEENLVDFLGINPKSQNAYNTSLDNKGNNVRIANLMKKAKNGGSYVIAVLGGSITVGASASSVEKSYGYYIKEWWVKNFPKATFKFISAGIGGTNPQMACARLEADLLSYKPDLVVIDFNVNGGGEDMYSTYSTLIYRIAKQSNSPAVMSIQFACFSGTVPYGSPNPKSPFYVDVNIKNAISYYNIPSINYGDYIWSEMVNNNIAWNDVTVDSAHPNDNGHYIAGCLIGNHLDYVKANIDTIKGKASFPAPSQTRYCDYKYITDGSENATVNGFTKINYSDYITYHGWMTRTTGSTISFTLPKGVKEIFIFGIVTGETNGTITLLGNGEVEEVSISTGSFTSPTFYPVTEKLGTEITLRCNIKNTLVRIYGIAYR